MISWIVMADDLPPDDPNPDPEPEPQPQEED